MGVLKSHKNKTKTELVKDVANGTAKNNDVKVKKKKKISCFQCIKPAGDDGGVEGKYRVAAPELMQDTFMSDSEDEGGEVECPIQQQQQYRYMNSEAGTLHRAKPLEDSVTDGHLWPSNNDRKVATIERRPVDIGFLVSFVVDARGGAMKAKRRGGVRIIVPPAACSAPTRVTCRAASRRAPVAAPPPLMEGEALASRLLELQPQGFKFLAPVIIEVPIFTSSCREREIVVLRSDTGETWQDHYLHNNDNTMIQEALRAERQQHGNTGEAIGENGERVTRIITCDFPHYLAVVSRVRQEVHIIGPEGGTVSSAHIPQVQALFPAAALTKRIRVGVQAHGAEPALCRRVLPRHAAVSPVITVEPRRRKFHRTITLTAPLPPATDGKPDKSTSNLRLLCSIMGGQARAVWEDVTGSTPLTITDDCASFTTTVSARFWLMNCQNVTDATKLATELYREMLLVPFDVRIVVLGKRLDSLEGRLLVMYITDRYAYDTLLQQEHYTEVAHSTSVRFLDGKEVYLEFSGNLVPVTKSGSQPMLKFEAFKDNRVEFPVRVKHHEETPSGRIYFMNEPKVPKGEQSQTPACVLDVELPDRIAPRAGKSQLDYLNLDQSGFDALKDELSFHWGDHNHSLGPASLPHLIDTQVNGHDKIITNGDIKLPTKDENDRVTHPQANGDTVHSDSNNTKATFDSDEDKTPMNTLEKGKKKAEGNSFFGGIADKVKHVFSHGEDVDSNVKESSPKPQPKPRESKEKSPPKPAPRIINEDLLDKVEDMFKDLHSKPHYHDDDDPNSEIYTTKLVVDEDERPSGLHDIKEEIYEQYENMQPVDTPIQIKSCDPFQFYVGCCEGKYQKGQKHRHDETSNIVDRIEHVKFAGNETISEVSDKVKNIDDLDKLEKEKENIKQKTNEAVEDILVKFDKSKGTSDLGDTNVTDDAAHNNFINDKNVDVKTVDKNLHENLEGQNLFPKVCTTIDLSTNSFCNKLHELNFAAMEREQEMKLRGLDRSNQHTENLTHIGQNIEKDFKNTAQELNHGLRQTIGDLENETMGSFAKTVNDNTQAAHNVASDMKSKVDNLKDEVHSKSKKKSKEGKNFLSGLVHNIFGEKDKVEQEIKDKIKEEKDSAKEMLDQTSEKKDEIVENLSQKHEELKDNAHKLEQSTKGIKDNIENIACETKNNFKNVVNNKKDEAVDHIQHGIDSIHNKSNEVGRDFNDLKHKTDTEIFSECNKIEGMVNNKKENIKSSVDSLVANAQQGIENFNKSMNKTEESLTDMGTDAKLEVSETVDDLHSETTKKAKESKNFLSGLVHNIFGEKEKIESNLKEKNDEVKETVQDLSQQVTVKKDEFIGKVDDKYRELELNGSNIVKDFHEKKDELENSWFDHKDMAKKTLQDNFKSLEDNFSIKTDTVVKRLHDTKEDVTSAVESKKNELQEATKSIDRLTQEVGHAAEQIKTHTKDSMDAVSEKKSELQSNLSSKIEELQQSGKDQLTDAQKSVSDNVNDFKQFSEQAVAHAQDSTLSTFDKFESSAKDKVNDAKDTWEDLQSSSQDTYADLKNDGNDLMSSTQDTLHSFQSSAGNTFDSLDDSARELLDNARDTKESAEDSAKVFFGHVKDTFEGFQVSADNKLEDIKADTKNTLKEAGERLRETTVDAQERIKGSEQAVIDTASNEADKFSSNFNDLGNTVFGSSGKGFIKDSSTKLLESEKAQSSPHKKSSGIPKLKKKNRK